MHEKHFALIFVCMELHVLDDTNDIVDTSDIVETIVHKEICSIATVKCLDLLVCRVPGKCMGSVLASLLYSQPATTALHHCDGES